MVDQNSHPRSMAVCVLGMHRSGTSALARLINLLGADLGNDLVPASVDNPKGFWEHRGIVEIHEDLLDALGSSFDDILPLAESWNDRAEVIPFRDKLVALIQSQFSHSALWGFKDPRTCRLLPMWHQIFDRANVDARYLLMIRNPHEIARSLAARDGWSFNKALLLTTTHMLEAERGTRGLPRMVVSFDRLLNDWRAVAAKAGNTLGIAWPKTADEIQATVAEFLDPNLRHHSLKEVRPPDGADEMIVRWSAQLHEMLVGADDDAARIDSSLVDRIFSEIQANQARLACWREQRSLGRKIAVVEKWAAKIDSDARERVANLEAHVAEVMSARDWLAKEKEAAAIEIVARDEEIARLRAWVAELEVSQKFLSAERDKLVTERADRLEEREKLAAQIRDLKQWISELETGRDWLTSENQRLTKWADELRDGSRWLEGERDKLVAQLNLMRNGDQP